MSASYPTLFDLSSKDCPAKTLSPIERKDLAVDALKGGASISSIAKKNNVSRKFIYEQKAVAEEGIDSAFEEKDSEVLFYLPVTKKWLSQLILALLLICHCSYRGVQEILRDLFGWKVSSGSVHNIVHEAIAKVKVLDIQEDLSQAKVGAHDEIFQGSSPVLAGCEPDSLYCYLLTAAEHRDGETWAIHLLECQDKGFYPDYTVADFGKGLRAGQKEAMPDVPCLGDHFHVLYDFGKLVTHLENRAYTAMGTVEQLTRKMHRAKKKGKGTSLSRKLGAARNAESQSIALADDLRTLLTWMQELLSPIGYDYPIRKDLFTFIVEELEAREHRIKRIASVRKLLKNNQEEILSFAKMIDDRFTHLAEDLGIDTYFVREMYACQSMPDDSSQRHELEESLRKHLGWRFHMVQEAVCAMPNLVVRASSSIENFNSRLRNYFFLRKHVGMDYLILLRFFLNHRRFLSSEVHARKNRSAAEILQKKKLPHWLEQLGHTLFKQAA